MDSLQAGALSGVDRDELMQQVKQEIALANAQELLTVTLHNYNIVTFFFFFYDR